MAADGLPDPADRADASVQAGRTADEATARARFAEIADTCGGCRRCIDRCSVFPRLFELLEERDAGAMTPDEQDGVVDACWQCGRCLDGCPYGPGVHEVAVDLADSVRRVRHAVVHSGRVPVRDRVGDRLLGRPDLVGRLAVGPGGTLVRPVLRSFAAFGRVRLDLPARGERFSRWWERRVPPADRCGDPDHAARPVDLPDPGDVLVFPTCSVEFGAPAVGRALVGVHERLIGPCRVGAPGCCGAPWLHSGDLDRFRRTARRTMAGLAAELGDDTVVLVAEASCAEAMASSAPGLIDDPQVATVAARVRGPIEHLVGHLGASPVPAASASPRLRVVHHVSCRSSDAGMPVVELLGHLGADVTVVQQCSGVGDAWGARRSRRVSVQGAVADLVERIAAVGPAPPDVVTSECRATATALAAVMDLPVLHPAEVSERLCDGRSQLPLAEWPSPF